MDPAGDTIGVQSFQDIENYLANFNKEISEAADQRYILTPAGNGNSLYADTSTIFQTPTASDASRNTKLEPGSESTMIDMVSPPGGTDATGFDLAVTADGLIGQNQQLLALHGTPVGATPVGTDDLSAGVTDQSQNLIGEEPPVTGGNNNSVASGYQTVTIVPSEVNQAGEVSYVLIVSQQDKEDETNADLSVYDFKEEAKGASSLTDAGTYKHDDDDDEGIKKSVRRSAVYAELGGTSSVGGASMHLMCNYCNYTSPKRYLLARHMKAHSEERPFKCSICSRTFKTIPALQNHVNTHTGVRPQHCKECDAAFTTSGELVRHVRYRHTYEKPHRCTECDYASVELSKLKRHVRSHTGERPYQCPHCVYASPDTYKLKRHLRIHTGEKPYLCDICQLRFTQSNSLKAHKLIHTGHKPIFQCELCPTTCGRKTDLKYHVMKLHTSDRPLQCRKCGKAFPDRYTYKIHLKTHDGEKCFRCELCPYSALDQRHLESHILTHTGEKPFCCDYCDQSFRQKQLLRRHIKLYHVPGYIPPQPRDKIHLCTHCHKAFAHRGNLLRHLTLHDPNNMEYEEAMRQGEASTGDEGEDDDEEEVEDGEDGEDGTTFLELHNAVTGADGVQLTEIDGDQMQVQLVRVEGQEGEQVYIQIGDQMEMLTQQQARQVQEEAGLLISVDNEGPASAAHNASANDDEQEDEDETAAVKVEVSSPAKKQRGRPRKSLVHNRSVQQPDSDEDYNPVMSRSPRGRGRGRGHRRSSSGVVGRKVQVQVDDDEQEQDEISTLAEDSDVLLTVNRKRHSATGDEVTQQRPSKQIKLETTPGRRQKTVNNAAHRLELDEQD